ncbi:MAG: carboxylesterase family protein [Desulfobacterales bacterium]|nr:carboxylesterase family protein [Desulfobacterales bacterium]
MKCARHRLPFALMVLILWAPLVWSCVPHERPLVLEKQERAGANCPAGGIKRLSGMDDNGNGELDKEEVERTRYCCDAYNFTAPVSTTSGKLRGLQSRRARIFRGIPFAAPPTGDLRWQAPVDPQPWSGILTAAASKDVCAQAGMDATWHATGQNIGSEDCLYLDVYRPNSKAANLPVYVYFHGGANRFGGGTTYDGTYLANDQNMIVVIAQYRLGPLGWFRHPALRTGDPLSDSGNFGTLDNIKALEWVRDNIAGFGGNPAQVTVGGQSAGAANVAKLLVSPQAAGLFQGAVLQSLGGEIITPAQGDALAEGVLAKLGYDPAQHGDAAQFLRGKSAQELIAAHGTTYAGFADGTVLPGRVIDLIHAGTYNAVPVLIGSTAREWQNFMPLYAPYPPPAGYNRPLWANVYDLFDPAFKPDDTWTFDQIFPTPAEVDLYAAIGKYRSLGWKYKAVDELASLLQQRQDGVWAFLFKWGGPESASPEFAHIFGPAHGMDIPLFFGWDTDLFDYALSKANRQGYNALQEAMMQYLGSFVRSGDPGAVGDAQWAEWSNAAGDQSPKCMLLDADLTHARIGMDTQKISMEALQAEAAATVAGWPAADSALVTGSLAAYPVEYIFNDRGYELMLSSLKFTPLTGARAFSGVHAQAGYRIEVPGNWQAGDDLVMYAHGFVDASVPRLAVTTPGRLRNYLIGSGFAWAASSYTANGYDIASGVQSTKALLDYFKQTHGEPGRVFLVGHSMGGHVTARTITDPNFKADYDGALPMCGVVGGGVELFSYFLDWGLLANYYAELDYEVPFTSERLTAFRTALFGAAGDGHGALGYLPPLGAFGAAGVMAALNPDDEALKTASMYRSGGRRPLYDTAFSRWATFAINSQSLKWLTDPTAASGTNMVGNGSTVYQLDDDPEPSAAEIALNSGIRRVSDPVYGFEELMLGVTGQIDIPVLTLHTIGDLFVPFSMEQIWARRIADAGNDDLFRARAIRSGNHCAFTLQEEVEAFMELVAWVGDGPVPEGDAILDPATVAADDFGCRFTRAVNPLYGDDPTRYRDDPDYAAVCAATEAQ